MSIVERMPDSVVAASWKNAVRGIVVFAVVGIGIHIALLLAFDRPVSISTAIVVFLFPWFVLALVFLLISRLRHESLKAQIPTVELHDDKLIVRFGTQRLEARVKDCHVSLGKAGAMRLPGRVVCWSHIEVILIDLPPWWDPVFLMRRKPRRIRTVAVGFTPATKAEWEQALLRCMARDDPYPS